MKRTTLAGLALVLCLVSCAPADSFVKAEHSKLTASMRTLWKDNPESLQILKDAHAKGIHLQVIQQDLPGDELGATRVSPDSATITVDVAKVDRVGDNLVPVLAHEIYHVRDAYLKLGTDAFLAQAAAEQDQSWESRPLEVLAIRAEDSLRQKLLQQHPQEFRGMARTRAEANQRAHNR